MYTRLHYNRRINPNRLVLFSMIGCIGIPFCQVSFASQDQTSETILESLRMLSLKNESSAALIKMEYTLNFSRSDDGNGQSNAKDLTETGHLRSPGVRFSHYAGLWAQDGIKQHSSIDYYSQGKWYKGNITIIDGEVKKWGKKPDLMQGAIDYMEKFNWREIGPTKLGMRPFEAHNWLSELLVPKYASAYEKTEIKDGRETYIVDIKRALDPPYYARMWIDAERGLPIEIEYYGMHPSKQPQIPMGKIESIKHYQLPNGGWIPVAGTRSVFYPNLHPRVRSEHVVVDVNSITIKRDEIPESLFTLTFPKGARVNNYIVGMYMGEVDMITDISVQSLETSDVDPDAAANQSTKALVTEQSRKEPNQASFKNTEGLEQKDSDSNNMPVMSQTGKKIFGVIGILLCTLLGASALTFSIWIIKNRQVESQGVLK